MTSYDDKKHSRDSAKSSCNGARLALSLRRVRRRAIVRSMEVHLVQVATDMVAQARATNLCASISLERESWAIENACKT